MTPTPRFDSYLKNWRLYKRAFLAFAIINAFSLSASLVVGIHYFGFKRAELAKQSQLLARTQKADQALELLSRLQRDLGSRSMTWSTLAVDAQVVPLLKDLGLEIPAQRSDFDKTAAALTTVKSQSYQELNRELVSYANIQNEIIATGLLTLIFGFLLPMGMMILLARALNSVRRQIHESVVDFLRSWRQTEKDYSHKDGPDAFKDREFWLQILLLIGQYSGQFSGHPAAQMAGEIAFMVRQELRRTGEPADPAA